MWNLLMYDSAYLVYRICLFLFVPMFVLSLIASLRVNSVFSKYNRVACSSGRTAYEYARGLLDQNGLYSVGFAAARGSLTDNYNPRTNVISLSDTVRNSNSVGAIGVACHEAGHAVQHAKNYFFARTRLALVPVVNFAGGLIWPLFIVGFCLGFASPYTLFGQVLIIIGLAAVGCSLLFSLVTLPTEFDASKRAYKFLKSTMPKEEAIAAKKVLNAAAMTYVTSFLMTSLQFIYLLALLFVGRGRRR